MKSTLAGIRTLVLPYGATTGARIILDGVNGRILVYNAANVLVEQIDSAGILVNGNNGNFVKTAVTGGTAIEYFRPADLTGVPAANISEGAIFASSVDSPPTNQYMIVNFWAPHIVGDDFPRVSLYSRDTLAPANMLIQIGDSSGGGLCDIDLNGLVFFTRVGVAAAYRVRIFGEAFSRLEVATTGLMSWGSGAAVADTNLFRSAANILRTDDSFSIGLGLRINTAGAAATMGRATLVAGTLVVNTTAVTAISNIFLTCQVPGGAPGFLRISARVVGTSFTILSSSATDTSVVAWQLVEPA